MRFARIIAGLGLSVGLVAGGGCVSLAETPGEHFEKAMKRLAENCARHRRSRLSRIPRSDGAGILVDLGRIEVQKEIVQHSPAALIVIMGLERVGINMPPLASGQ